MKQKAYGKINLGLDVIRRRPDGYHEVKMIMQTVDIWDELTMTERDDDAIVIKTDKAELPNDEQNLIYKAILKYREHTGENMGVEVSLVKNIPIAAGMAGGSTDAAAALRMYNELCKRNLSVKELMQIGVRVGADVPYCIIGGTALSEGIGELLTPLAAPPDCVLVVAKPQVSVSTKYVYENLHLEQLEKHPDIDGMRSAIEEGNLAGICERMDNVLATVTEKEYPIINTIKEVLEKKGAVKALMSGSGPTVFGVFLEEEKAKEAQKELVNQNLTAQSFVTRFFN